MSLKNSEVLQLAIQDLNRMKQEFLEAYEKLFNDAYNRLRRSLTLKLKAMRICAEKENESKTARSHKSLDLDQDPKDISEQLKFSS